MAAMPYVDQVVRQQEYQADHPEVEICNRVSYWEARIPRPGRGEDRIFRHSLGALLDSLKDIEQKDRES